MDLSSISLNILFDPLDTFLSDEEGYELLRVSPDIFIDDNTDILSKREQRLFIMTDLDTLVTQLSAHIRTSNLNNIAKVVGLKSFLGVGIITDTRYPGKVFEPNPRRWLADIESQTPLGELWDLEGRLQVAEMYSEGFVRSQLHKIRQGPAKPSSWDEFFNIFIARHPTGDLVSLLCQNLDKEKRIPGELFDEFACRLESLVQDIISIDPEMKNTAEHIANQKFLHALPLRLQDKFKKKSAIYDYLADAVNYLERRPELNLTMEHIKKENKLGISTIGSSSKEKPRKENPNPKVESKSGTPPQDTAAIVQTPENCRGRGRSRGRGLQHYRGRSRPPSRLRGSVHSAHSVHSVGNMGHSQNWQEPPTGPTRGYFTAGRWTRLYRGNPMPRFSPGGRGGYTTGTTMFGDNQLMVICHGCNNPGHMVANCPNMFRGTCHKCRGFGHLARDCPQRELYRDQNSLGGTVSQSMETDVEKKKTWSPAPM